ncbi:MAG: hypothetical protein KatS3mg050_2414 [Litorilinea sp.]|nr:MAG: hypothetical protein KatS3mg050_2414 [Litorilinea sp.]
MDLKIDAQVLCQDGPCGSVAAVIVHPRTGEVTHLVVRQHHGDHTQRLVPMERVVDVQAETVRLGLSAQELGELDPFTETEYVRVEIPSYIPYGSLFPGWSEGYEYTEEEMVPVQHEHAPEGEAVIHRGARVWAKDGPVGQVDGFLLDPQTHRITHLVMHRGHLWGRKAIAIPVSAIATYEDEDHVQLSLDKEAIQHLPTP